MRTRPWAVTFMYNKHLSDIYCYGPAHGNKSPSESKVVRNMHLRVIQWLDNNLTMFVDYDWSGNHRVLLPTCLYFARTEDLLALRLATGI